MIETSYKIVRFHTNLPYNCIYHVTGNQQYAGMGRRPSDYDQKSMTDIQGFPFHFRNIASSDMSENGLQELMSNGTAGQDVSAKEMMQVLREVFPVSPKGCFVVRLLPILNDMDGEAVDTFLIGTRTVPSPHDAVGFSMRVAEINYERMTGKPYENDMEEEEEGSTFGMVLRSDVDVPKSLTHSMSFQTNRERKKSYVDKVVRTQNQIIKMYQKKFVELAKEPKPTFDQFKDLVVAAFGDVQNVTKIHRECPIKVDYCVDNQEYEVMLCPEDDEPIICDFQRGPQSKALYVFFLRHPEGIRLKRLMTEEYVKELAQIYAKLKDCDKDEAYRKAKSLIKGRSQYINDIKSLFADIFVPVVAGKYSIAPLEEKRNNGLYGIVLNDDLIDLGNLDGKL